MDTLSLSCELREDSGAGKIGAENAVCDSSPKPVPEPAIPVAMAPYPYQIKQSANRP
jgi:hypothetical protein